MFRPLSAALLVASLGACGAQSGDPSDGLTPGAADSGDEPAASIVATVAAEADPERPLVAWVTVTAPSPGRAHLVATAEGAPDRETPLFEVGPTPVTVPFLGLRAATDYRIATDVTLGDGGRAAGDTRFTPGPLPDDLPAVTVQVANEDEIEPGIIVFPLSKWEGGPVAGWGYVVGIDEGGVVCFVAHTDISSTFTWTDDGSVLLTALTESALQLDPLGRTERSLVLPEVGLESIHHELVRVPGESGDPAADDAHLLLLSSELRVIDGYDDGVGGTRTHNVVGDVVVETDWSGAVHHEVRLFDLLDPLRTTPDFDLPFWQIPPYDDVDTPKDWSHGNAILPLDDGAWMVSLRNQDWLLGLDPETESLLWKMGFEGDFELLNGRWFSTQHSPRLLGGDRLLLYDNGANRPGEGFPNSRVVEYAVDWEARTVSQTWEYRGAAPYYVPAAGDVDPLPGGNLLITDGGVVDAVQSIGGVLVPHLSPRVIELTGEGDDRAPALQVVVGTWGDWYTPGYIAYRGDKVESLYGSRGIDHLAR